MGTPPRSPVWQRLLARPVQFGLDLLVLVAAFVFAYAVRFEFDLSATARQHWLAQIPLVILIQFAALFMARVYSFVWRYVGLAEVRAFVSATGWSAAVVIAMRLWLPESLQAWRLPLSVIVIDSICMFLGTLGLRVLRRLVFEHFERTTSFDNSLAADRKRVILVGAGRAGVLAAKEILGHAGSGLEICGFVDDDPLKVGNRIQGIEVLGPSEALPMLAEAHRVDHVIITIARASRAQFRRLVGICDKAGIKARVIPGLLEILDGTIEVSRIHDVEIEDLLGREPVQLDDDVVRSFLTGKAVMVTGAGGSIGSELARQVARFAADPILLVERAEFALFEIDTELRERWPERTIVPLVADIGDRARMEGIFADYGPAVVIHAAAHKHVPLMESNSAEAIKNNVLGTFTLADIAGRSGTEAFVQISTDKAVRPTSLMGASKRMAELVIQDLNSRHATRYVSVRFGNVLGSAGSVVPIFRKQILKGGPITITHPEMVRYFMTIPEATQLVLQAGAMGQGGEIFILDMGEPVRIVDLASDMITLSGLKPHEDIEIVFSGVRPGEKLFEELETQGESTIKTHHPKIFVGRINGQPDCGMDEALARLRELAFSGTERDLRAYLGALLPEAQLAPPARG